jgi:hypothetical protein
MKCFNCALDDEQYTHIEIREMACGIALCDDCRSEHHHCPACAYELNYNEPEYFGGHHYD